MAFTPSTARRSGNHTGSLRSRSGSTCTISRAAGSSSGRTVRPALRCRPSSPRPTGPFSPPALGLFFTLPLLPGDLVVFAPLLFPLLSADLGSGGSFGVAGFDGGFGIAFGCGGHFGRVGFGFGAVYMSV